MTEARKDCEVKFPNVKSSGELIIFLLCSTRMPCSSLFGVLNTLAGFEDRSSNLWGEAGKYFLLLWFNRLSCSVCPLREPIDLISNFSHLLSEHKCDAR